MRVDMASEKGAYVMQCAYGVLVGVRVTGTICGYQGRVWEGAGGSGGLDDAEGDLP